MLPKKVRYRTGVAAVKKLPLVHQNEPVRLRVGRKNSRFAEDVGSEDRTVPVHSLVDEGLWVVTLVGGYELQGLTDEGEA